MSADTSWSCSHFAVRASVNEQAVERLRPPLREPWRATRSQHDDSALPTNAPTGPRSMRRRSSVVGTPGADRPAYLTRSRSALRVHCSQAASACATAIRRRRSARAASSDAGRYLARRRDSPSRAARPAVAVRGVPLHHPHPMSGRRHRAVYCEHRARAWRTYIHVLTSVAARVSGPHRRHLRPAGDTSMPSRTGDASRRRPPPGAAPSPQARDAARGVQLSPNSD